MHPNQPQNNQSPNSPTGSYIPQPSSQIQDEYKHSNARDLFAIILFVIAAILTALLVGVFVFRTYQVDGQSMETTLQNQDKLIIWKLPKTWSMITHHQYVPNRGDVIVFTQTGLSAFGQEDKKQLIKRVIALPGERVVISNGQYTVYNATHPAGFNPDRTLSYGKNIPPTSGDVDITLSKDQLFVSGDNRPDSLDSRSFGPINTNQIVGKLVLRIFPINHAELY